MKLSIIPPIIYKILGIKNVAGVQINPATEEKQDAIVSSIIARNPLTHGGSSMVGNSKTKWRFEGRNWGGESDEIWDLIQTGTGQTISALGNAGGARYLNIASGTQVGETIIQSKEVFSPPFNFAYGLTLSQQIANQEAHIEFVEVDDNGNVIVDNELFSAPFFNDARSGFGLIYDGITTTSARLKIRSRGISEQVNIAVSHGTGFRVATGTTPNFLPTLQGEMTFNTDRVMTGGRAINSVAARSEVTRSTAYVPDPDGKYKLRIRVKNLGTVTTTDVRLHFARVVDMTRLSVDFGAVAGSTSAMDAPPVSVLSLPTLPAVTTLTTLTNAGTPVAPATPYFVNSLATTNGALVLTGTSAVQFLYATNEGASHAYIKLYNKATAPTVGTDIPEMTIPVPPAVGGVPGVANPIMGVYQSARFALGLGIAITRNAIHTDTTAIGAGEVKVKLSRSI